MQSLFGRHITPVSETKQCVCVTDFQRDVRRRDENDVGLSAFVAW